jgi:hypothetical protein
MPILTVFFGLLLCGLSLFTLLLRPGGMEGAFTRSPTWLIPAGFGLCLIVLGLLSQKKPGVRKHAMHTAAMVGMIGTVLCLFQGVGQLRKLVAGNEVNMLAVGMVWSMAVICLTFVGTCIQSFVAARKARQEAARQESAQQGSQPGASS